MAGSKNDPAKRRGPKTSEWWLALAASIIGLAVMAGWVTPEGVSAMDKFAGLACAALASFGYSVSRGLAKQPPK